MDPSAPRARTPVITIPLMAVALVVTMLSGQSALASGPARGDGDGCDGPLPRAGQRFEGRVQRVIDGDSLCVATAAGAVEVRLVDFDAPERGQKGAREATEALRRLTADKAVTCRAGHRSHDRTVAICRLGGVPLGDLMRRRGLREGGN